jgi:hypothetical protein
MIFGFEAFHGNLALAIAQIQTGVAIISDWRASYLHSGKSSSGPDEEVIETFLSLEIQIMTFHDERPYETHAALRTEYAEKIRKMPCAFTSMWEATKYFYVVRKHLEHFLQVAKRLRRLRPGAGKHDMATKSREKNLLEEAKSYQVAQQAELNRWYASFKLLLEQADLEHDSDDKARAVFLLLHFKSSNLLLQTALTTDEMIYDDYTTEFSELISLAALLIKMIDSKSRTAKWIFDLGAIMPLYLIALKCRVSGIRRQALELLLRSPRREGIWDSILAGKMVGWVQKIEEEMMEEEILPGWARVEDVQSSFDLQDRRVEMRCLQRFAEGLLPEQRSAIFQW